MRGLDAYGVLLETAKSELHDIDPKDPELNNILPRLEHHCTMSYHGHKKIQGEEEEPSTSKIIWGSRRRCVPYAQRLQSTEAVAGIGGD